MNHEPECRRTLTTAFEEVALALSDLVADYPIPDEATWDLSRTLDLIHERACGRCGGREVDADQDPDDAEHPAIVHLLAQLRGRRAEHSDRGSR